MRKKWTSIIILRYFGLSISELVWVQFTGKLVSVSGNSTEMGIRLRILFVYFRTWFILLSKLFCYFLKQYFKIVWATLYTNLHRIKVEIESIALPKTSKNMCVKCNANLLPSPRVPFYQRENFSNRFISNPDYPLQTKQFYLFIILYSRLSYPTFTIKTF